MKLLSVTVPCYNSQAYMEKCVDSLLEGGDQVEILIVDDGPWMTRRRSQMIMQPDSRHCKGHTPGERRPRGGREHRS